MSSLRKVLTESIVVLFVGSGLALLANRLSPRGLNLGHNYFPAAGDHTSTQIAPPTLKNSQPGETNSVESRFEANGLKLVSFEETARLFSDPRRSQEVIIFVDARNDEHFRQAHIPGAYQFDHYHPLDYLPKVLPACQTAEQIVVYCTGGNCEDSEFAALALIQTGVPKERLTVFLGGITEWTNHAQPIETGLGRTATPGSEKP